MHITDRLKSRNSTLPDHVVNRMIEFCDELNDESLVELTRCAHTVLVSRFCTLEEIADFDTFIEGHRKLVGMILESLDRDDE